MENCPACRAEERPRVEALTHFQDFAGSVICRFRILSGSAVLVAEYRLFQVCIVLVMAQTVC